jgi:hypothetical protein
MIKNILIMSVIAALVPTAMSNVSASADAKIALFSTASSDSNGLFISGNGDSAKMELKATNDNGKSNRVLDFQLTADNVLSIEAGDKVTVKDNVDFTKAVTTDARNNQKSIGITSNGVIDFTGYAQGVYTLDVVVEDDRAYEAIIAIGDQTNQIVDKEITRVNSEYTTKIEFVYPPIEDPKPPKDIGLPYCDLISSAVYKAIGSCFDRQDDGSKPGFFGCRDGSDVRHYEDCKDAGEHPAEQLKRTMPKPEPNPEPIECSEAGYIRQGNECVAVDCELYADNPCSEYTRLGNPNAAEEIIPVDEEVPTEGIDCELQPELCEENIVEIPEEEELTEEIESEEIETEDIEEEEEVEEESGDSEGSEESGGSGNEEEDEGSEQESQGGN